MNQIEIEKGKPIPKCIWKIKEIDVNIVIFSKHLLSEPIDSLLHSNKYTLNIKESIGTEKHKVTPDIQLELSGKVGETITSFESNKTNNVVKVNKIVW